MKVKLYNKISMEGLQRFEKDKFSYSEEYDEYDALLVRSAKLHDMNFPSELKCIARAGAGVNNIPLESCSEKGIVVFNTPGANANAVKELVIAGLILASRKVVQGIIWAKSITDDDVAKCIEANKSKYAGPEIAGKKLGVIGLGAIGVQVANAAAAMNMDVYGYDPFVSVQAAWTLKARVNHVKDIQEIFEECDYITVHVPFNEQTKNLIDSAALAKMKNGVRILNLARNGLIDEVALLKSLEAGKVDTYVCDFASKELLVNQSVIAIPHLGASTPESEENCAVMAVDEVKAFLNFGTIHHSVNFPDMEVTPVAKYRLCICNQNIPDMLKSMTETLSNAGINIENMVNKARGDVAYTIIETNNLVSDELLKSLQEKKGITRVRLLMNEV